MCRLAWGIGILWVVACGDDGAGDDAPASTSGEATTSSGGEEDSESTAAAEESSDAESSSSEGADSSGDAPATESSSEGGGAAEDPEYPNPSGGGCEGNQVPIMLPGGSVCAPMCSGEGDTCPAGATGDAVPTCTPFEDEGGSGDACTDSTTCPDGEACSFEGTCVAVAFWACRLLCQGGESCPDGMTCAGAGACGYP